ncbi:MAG: hypothetical protein H0U97_09920 [Gammaproteobacteria bacterium]|nr:hypothetical protein [Gammaproteobacteria bacterium]
MVSGDGDLDFTHRDAHPIGLRRDIEAGAEVADADGAGHDLEGAPGVVGDGKERAPRVRSTLRWLAPRCTVRAVSVLSTMRKPSRRSIDCCSPFAVT